MSLFVDMKVGQAIDIGQARVIIDGIKSRDVVRVKIDAPPSVSISKTYSETPSVLTAPPRRR
jgi:sRNA-binding carbon storage regulator CsrA